MHISGRANTDTTRPSLRMATPFDRGNGRAEEPLGARKRVEYYTDLRSDPMFLVGDLRD